MLEPELRQELKDLINEVLDEREHERKLNGLMISPKKIKTIGDRCLRQKSEEVEFDKDEMEKLHAEMCQAMWMADGIGLAHHR